MARRRKYWEPPYPAIFGEKVSPSESRINDPEEAIEPDDGFPEVEVGSKSAQSLTSSDIAGLDALVTSETRDFRSDASAAVKKSTTKLSHLQKVYLIFDELAQYGGDEFSSAELLEAAHALVALSKREYSTRVARETKSRPHYFSWPVDELIIQRPFLILSMEVYMVSKKDLPDYSSEALERFRVFNESLNDPVWEF